MASLWQHQMKGHLGKGTQFGLMAILGILALVFWPVASLAKPELPAFYTVLQAALNAPAGTLLRHEPFKLPRFYRAKAWRIIYVTRDFRNRPIASSGIVVLSDYAPVDRSKRNIVAWAHPTTGVARRCAPSLRSEATGIVLGLPDLVARGYVVVASDYPGLGTAGPIGYLVSRGQAFATLDSVRAARQIPEVGSSNRFALWGYSQGGHAALSAENWAARYAPELSLVGTAAIAPPTDLKAIFTSTMGSVTGRILTAMTLSSWTRKYDLSLESAVLPEALSTVRSISNVCLDDLDGKLEALSAQKPLPNPFLKKDVLDRIPWDRIVTENSLFGVSGNGPLFIAQGENDRIVPREITARFVRSACRSNAPVQFLVLPVKSHGTSARASIGPAVRWIDDRFAGRPAPSNCPQIQIHERDSRDRL